MAMRVSKLLLFTGILLIIGSLGDTFIRSFPPQLLNPEWELQTLSLIADSTPLLVVSLIIITLSKVTSALDGKESFKPSKFFARLSLFFLIVYILSIPLTIVDSYRVNNRTSGSIARQQKSQLSQVTSVESAINNQLTDRQIEQLKRRLSLPNNSSPEQVKKIAFERIKRQRDSLIKNSQESIIAARSRIIASAIRSILSFSIGIGCFLMLFKYFSTQGA